MSWRSLMRNTVNDLPATKRRRLVTLPAAAIALALATAPAGPPPDLDTILNGSISRNAFWGVYVQHVETGETWYEHNASNAFIPASNQKIFTSATALDALGSDYRYRTVLYSDGQVEGSVLKGDLVLRGSGDPTFGSEQVRRGDPLRTWATDLADMGITRIEGRIVGDDNAFDDQPYAEGWDIDFVTSRASREVGVSIGGLAYNDNVVLVNIRAGSPGRPARVSMNPDGFLDFRNRMVTANRRRGIAITTHRDFRNERITLQGSLPRTYNGTVGVPVANPTAFAAATFTKYLREAGIEVQGEPVDIDDLNNFRYDREQPLFVYVSPPLLDILHIVNKESNNFYAEQVFRTYASNGSAQGAENRIKQLLRRAGAATGDIEIRDGSGLSRKNMITPRAMGNLLTYMHGHEQREAFLASLARGGERGSTLRYRLNRVPVRAKTGSLEFVRSLSGYVTTQGRANAGLRCLRQQLLGAILPNHANDRPHRYGTGRLFFPIVIRRLHAFIACLHYRRRVNYRCAMAFAGKTPYMECLAGRCAAVRSLDGHAVRAAKRSAYGIRERFFYGCPLRNMGHSDVRENADRISHRAFPAH